MDKLRKGKIYLYFCLCKEAWFEAVFAEYGRLYWSYCMAKYLVAKTVFPMLTPCSPTLA